jgi:Putative restriction endonuclease
MIVARRPDTVRGADVAFVSYERLPKRAVEDGFLQEPPELVIEVFSKDTSWEKVEEKIAEYHGFGVDLVWVLDPQTLTLRAYPREGVPAVLRDTDQASADPHVPGFTVREPVLRGLTRRAGVCLGRCRCRVVSDLTASPRFTHRFKAGANRGSVHCIGDFPHSRRHLSPVDRTQMPIEPTENLRMIPASRPRIPGCGPIALTTRLNARSRRLSWLR